MTGLVNWAHPPQTLCGLVVWDFPRAQLETWILAYLFIWEVNPETPVKEWGK